MPNKVYAVLYDANYIYVPIKAQHNAHDTMKRAFCSTMPAFFGGTYSGSESDGLKKEVKEESQGNFELSDTFDLNGSYALNLAQTASPFKAGYSFYAIKIDHADTPLKSNTAAFANDVCPLNKANATDDENEHSNIVRIPCGNITATIATDKLKQLLAFCTSKGHCKCANGSRTFAGSETKKAFLSFFA